MSTIFYWRGAVGDTAFIGMHDGVIRELIDGTYASGDLEKLAGHRDIYSYRISGSGRLLFTTIEVNGQRYLLLLEYLPTHDYQKSRFLRPGVLARYLTTQKEALAEGVLEFEPTAGVPSVLQGLEKEGEQLTALDYYHQEFIELTRLQQDALHISLPAVISGVAGSGKSCVATLLMSNYIEKHQDVGADARQVILYVSESPRLVQSIAKDWHHHPAAQDNLHIDVQFKTYDDLLVESAELNDKTMVCKSEFNGWYIEYTKHQHDVLKIDASKNRRVLCIEDSDDVYQEFRVCSAYSALDYYALGVRQSKWSKGSHREELYKAYIDYQKHLRARRVVHPPFYSMVTTDVYDLVVVDESQDFSHLQLSNLAKLAKHRNIACCMDSHQSLLDVQSKRPFLLNMLRRSERDVVSHIELPVSYRCPLNIACAANEIIQIKYKLTGGRADKKEAPSIAPNIGRGAGIGHVVVVNQMEITAWAWLNEQTRGAHLAVVASHEFVAEARQLFQTELVFTPDEIKGLEYDTVVVYRPFSTARFTEAYRRIHKAEEADDGFAPDFNRLFTSFTRAKRTLVICQERDSRESGFFLKPLQMIMADEPLFNAERIQETTSNDWKDEIMRQVDVDQKQRAFDIYRAQFNPGASEEAFSDFITQNMKKIEPALCSVPTIIPPASTLKATLECSGAIKKQSPSTQKKMATMPMALTSPRNVSSILALLDDFSERRLIVFLKAMDFQACWLRTPVEWSGQTLILFHHMLSSIEKTKCFSDAFIKMSDLNIKWIDKTALVALLAAIKEKHAFSQLNPEIKMRLLGPLLISEPALLRDKYMSEWLSLALSSTGIDGIEQGLLFWLVSHAAGIHLLRCLLDKHPKFFGHIPRDAWVQTSQVNLNVSPLYQLTKTGAGVDFLLFLLQTHSALILSIPMKAWSLGCAPYNLSPLSELIEKKSGRFFLNSLFNRGNLLDQTESTLGIFLTRHEERLLDKGQTLLHDSVIEGHVAIIFALIRLFGADMNAQNMDGLTPFALAVHLDNTSIALALQGLGANVHKPDFNGATPLYIAAQREHITLIIAIHGFGANVNARTNDGATPVFIAAQQNKTAAIKALHDRGANLDIPDHHAATPFFAAVFEGHLASVTLLHELGANMDIPEMAGITPLFIATQKNHVHIVNYLIQHGANTNIAAVLAKNVWMLFFEGDAEGRFVAHAKQRMVETICERLRAGDKETQVALLPIDIAFVLWGKGSGVFKAFRADVPRASQVQHGFFGHESVGSPGASGHAKGPRP